MIPSRLHRGLPYLCALGFALAVAGYFAPWVAHRTAALTLSGWELTPWAKPLPEVRSGELLLRAPWLYAPLAAGGLGLSLLAARRPPRDVGGWLLRLAGAGLCLLALPPYPAVLSAWRPAPQAGGFPPLDPEFGGQFYLAALGALGCLIGAGVWFLPPRVGAGLRVLCAAAGAYFAPAMFTWMLPAIRAVYREPIGWGWGVWLTVAGFVFAGACSVAELLLASSTGERGSA